MRRCNGPTGSIWLRPGCGLAAAWRAIVTTLDAQRAPARALVVTDHDTMDILRYMFGRRVSEGATGADGRIEVEIRGPSEDMVARQLAGLADRVEVRAPETVRAHLAAIGRSLVKRYDAPSGSGDG